MSRQVLLFNPAAGGGRAASAASECAGILERAGHDVELIASTGPGTAPELIAARLGRGPAVDAVLALGGDGTLNEAAWGLLRAGAVGQGEPSVALGTIPLGTTNVIARDLGLPLDPVLASVTLAIGRPRRWDLGVAEAGGTRRPFLLACGVGFDAEAAARASSRSKRRLGFTAYWLAGLRAVGERGRPMRVEAVTDEGRALTGLSAASVLLGNSVTYAGLARLSRRSAPDDGVLELVLLPSTGLVPLVRASLHGIMGDISTAPGVEVHRVREVRVETPRPTPVHVDAEPGFETPVSFRVMHRALSLIAPAARQT